MQITVTGHQVDVTAALNDVLSMTDVSVNWGLIYFGGETTLSGETASPVGPIASMNSSAITRAPGRSVAC